MPKTVLLGIDNYLTFKNIYKNHTHGICKKVIHGPIEQPRLSFSAASQAVIVV